MKRFQAIAAAVILNTIPVCVHAQKDNGSGLSDVLLQHIRPEWTQVPAIPEDTVRICIVGDVMLHSAQIENCFGRHAASCPGADPAESGSYDFSPYFREIGDMLREADISIANMEFTLAGPPFSGYPAFCAPDSYAGYVAGCGVDVFLTANNHILDKGTSGALRTLEIYDRMAGQGIYNTGCFADSTSLANGYPLIISAGGLSIALVNFTYGTNVPPADTFPYVCDMDREAIARAMKTARENADIIIALPHWGTEYALKHSESQERMAEFLVRCGADAVIGSHPHVVQDTGYIKALNGDRIPVVYSLGNLISNMSAANTQIGLAVTLPVIRYSDGQARTGEPEYTFTWCSLPGDLGESHMTIPVREYIGKKEKWTDPTDYDKMISTYRNILDTSGIQDR